MSDPLSISAALIAFIGAALKTTNAVIDVTRGLSSAQGEIVSLTKGLEELKQLLEDLKSLHDIIGKCSTSQIKQAKLAPQTISAMNQELIELHQIMVRLGAQIARGSKFERFKARYTFALSKKNRIASHLQKIQQAKSALMASLAVFQTYQGHIIHKQVSSSGVVLSDMVATTNRTDNGVNLIQQSLTVTNDRVESLQASVSCATDDMDQIKLSLTAIDQRTKGTDAHTFRSLPMGLRHILPYPRNKRFVGRSEILRRIGSELLCPNKESDKMVSFALHGMSGVGKTQIANEFVHAKKHEFSAIFWISASSKEKIILGYIEIARAIGLDGCMSDQSDSVHLVKTWLDYTDVNWLIVFDNADNLKDLTPYWPAARKGAVLLTSQDSSSAHTLADQGFPITTFSSKEGVELIDNLSRSTPTPITTNEAEQVARTLGHHPGAINQMASIILESGWTVPGFLEMYAGREQANELQNLDCSCPWYPTTVATAFDLAIERAANMHSHASSLLDVLCLLDPDEIPKQLLSKECDELPSGVGRLAAMKDLRRNTLLNDNPERATISLHRLVQDAALRKIKSHGQRTRTAFNTATALLRKAFPLHGLARDHMTEMWADCETYLSHVLSLNERYKELKNTSSIHVSIDFIELVYSCAWYLCERGRFEISADLIETASEAYKSLTPRGSDLWWADLCTVRLFYTNETDHNETGIALATEAHQIREAAVRNGKLEKDHPNRANGFMNLGVMYTKIDPEEAIRLHTEAIEIRESSTRFKNDQVHGLALNYLNIGRSYSFAKRFDEAAEALRKCLAIIKTREDACGHRSALSAFTLWALANVEIDREQLETAFILHTESMELHESILGHFHLKTAASYHKMAWLLWKRGESTRAIDILKRALSVYDKRPDDLRAERARSKHLHSLILKDSGTDKEEVWKEELAVARRLREELLGETGGASGDTQEAYDELVAYFYR